MSNEAIGEESYSCKMCEGTGEPTLIKNSIVGVGLVKLRLVKGGDVGTGPRERVLNAYGRRGNDDVSWIRVMRSAWTALGARAKLKEGGMGRRF